VQYRETDYNFASRLMAEEGWYYFFKHGAKAEKTGFHQLFMTRGNYSVSLPNVEYRKGKGGKEGETDRTWEKVQELRSGRVTLRDHTFEKPEADLQQTRQIQPEVPVGTVTHKLNGLNADLEFYDYPGQFAKRADGVDRGGGEQPKEISDIYPDAERTARIRMEQEATAAVSIRGESDCRDFTAGHSFSLTAEKGSPEEHAVGSYLLTGVRHMFGLPRGYSSEDNKGFYYRNSFTCVPDPSVLPYRPLRTVPKPIIAGTQTAVVVGPKDGEVYTDKYGRVKVQFFWDREGKKDLDSSCWIRVAQIWADQRWGAHFWPRVGQEVVVAFEEGDPDQPIIVGSVYNAANMPPYEMPKHQTRSGIKTRSTPKGKPENFNEIRFEDKNGEEELYVQAERAMNVLVKGDENRVVGGDSITRVGGDVGLLVQGKKGLAIKVRAGHARLAAEKVFQIVGTNVNFEADDTAYLTAEQDVTIVSRRGDIWLDSPETISLVAKTSIELRCGGGSIVIDSDGNVFINGPSVKINSASHPHFVKRSPDAPPDIELPSSFLFEDDADANADTAEAPNFP
jgi:type VI secretion system secreted protein VgrG